MTVLLHAEVLGLTLTWVPFFHNEIPPLYLFYLFEVQKAIQSLYKKFLKKRCLSEELNPKPQCATKQLLPLSHIAFIDKALQGSI